MYIVNLETYMYNNLFNKTNRQEYLQKPQFDQKIMMNDINKKPRGVNANQRKCQQNQNKMTAFAEKTRQ